MLNDVHFKELSYHSRLKSFCMPTISAEEMKKQTKIIMYELISIAEKYISFFREFKNAIIGEHEFIETVSPLGDRID